MMSIITMLFVHMPLKWHQTFSPLFRSLIFWITRLENNIRIVRIETYFLLVHFHLNTNLKILSYSFWTRKGLLIFFHHGTKLIDRSMNECQKHACLLGLSSAASTCRWAAWGAPGSLSSWARGVFMYSCSSRWKSEGEVTCASSSSLAPWFLF